MSIPGISKVENRRHRKVPNEGHLCWYEAVVSMLRRLNLDPNRVKHGKYALKCAVRGAVSAGKNSAVKCFYLKHCRVTVPSRQLSLPVTFRQFLAIVYAESFEVSKFCRFGPQNVVSRQFLL